MVHRLASLLLVLAMMPVAAPAMTVTPPWPGLAPATIGVQHDVGAAGAAAAARNATGGKVLGVKSGQADGRTVYRVKVLLPGGRMRTVIVDGQTGKVQG